MATPLLDIIPEARALCYSTEMKPEEPWIPHLLTPDQKDEFEERKAILIIEAGMSEFEADFQARRICKERWSKK